MLIPNSGVNPAVEDFAYNAIQSHDAVFYKVGLPKVFIDQYDDVEPVKTNDVIKHTPNNIPIAVPNGLISNGQVVPLIQNPADFKRTGHETYTYGRQRITNRPTFRLGVITKH